MTTPLPAPASPFALGAADLPGTAAEALLHHAVVARVEASVVDVMGPSAVDCMQGLLTNDIVKPGDGAYTYGAVLTPKGMIVSDMWALRDGAKVSLGVPEQGIEALLDVLQRSVPPRLARTTHRGDAVAILRLAGPRAFNAATEAGISIPTAGRATHAIVGEAACTVARPPDEAPFSLEIRTVADEVSRVEQRLVDAGARLVPPATLELARILAGWPRLGAEIDAKTLPQEVRYDEINGVSYTKGCYTGQETVARVHFRGHPNRMTVGLVWESPPDADTGAVEQDGKVRGRVTSLAWLAPLEQYVGLALVRRETDPVHPVVAGGAPATISDLPFDLED